MILPIDIVNISKAYEIAGKDIFVVGGSVRDFLQGKSPKDFDLVTNALPEESKEILKKFNVSDEQGKNFGVLRVYTKNEPHGYEIASYRKDISKGRDTKGNDQKVEMGNHISIEDDCMRRDLTINALFYDIIKEEIVDIVGGIDDIKNKVIRSVGNPKERFIEDRLRICRIFRFTSRIGGTISKETSEAIKSDNRLRGISDKDNVSQERVWDEFVKSWNQSEDFEVYLNLLSEYKMWGEIFPHVKVNENFIKTKNFIIMMANIFIYNHNIYEKMVQELKIDINTSRKIQFLIDLEGFEPNSIVKFFKEKIKSKVDDSTIEEWVSIRNLNKDLFTSFIKYRPSVNAESLMEMGFVGKQLGEEIKRLEILKFKEIYES